MSKDGFGLTTVPSRDSIINQLYESPLSIPASHAVTHGVTARGLSSSAIGYHDKNEWLTHCLCIKRLVL